MKKLHKILLGMVLSLSVLAILAAATLAGPLEKEFSAVKDVITDIHILNLYNGLPLTTDQIGKLLAKAREAQKIEDEFCRQVKAGEKQYMDALRGVREEISRKVDVNPETAKRFNAVKEGMENVKDSYIHKMESLVKDVKNILTENQLVMVAEYAPCILPKKSTTNPERIGQSQDTSMAEKILSSVRNAPQDRYKQLKERHLDKLTKKLRKYYDESELSTELEKRLKVFDRVRSMSDEEFEIKKAELAREIGPPEHPAKRDKALDRSIAHFFLSSNALRILESRFTSAQR